MIRGSSVAESGETWARSGWFVALSGKSALSRGTGEKYADADDSGLSRGRVGGSRGGVVAHSCLVGAHSGETNNIKISTLAFLARSWHVLGRFVVKSC